MSQQIADLGLPTLSRLPANWGYTLPLALPEEYKQADFNKRLGQITAYLTVYKNFDNSDFVDPYMDVIVAGCFTKTIQELESGRKNRNSEWLVPTLWQHDRGELIGAVKSLSEDSKGVIYVAQLAMGVRRAQEAFELAEQKMIGTSYGYDPIRYEPKNSLRYLQEVRLREQSFVSFPANNIAPILGVKETPKIFAGASFPTIEQEKSDEHTLTFPEVEIAAPQVADETAEQQSPLVETENVEGKLQPEVQRIEKKESPDFQQAWGARASDTLMSVLYSMNSAMMRALTQTIDDDDLDGTPTSDQTARQAAITTILNQFGDAITNWLPTYQAADDLSDPLEEDDSATMSSCCSADMTSIVLRDLSTELSVKAGRVLSDKNRKRLVASLSALRLQAQNIEMLLADSEPKPKTDVTPSSEEKGLDITQSLATLQWGTSQAPSIFATPPQTPLPQKATAPISFPQEQEFDITELLATIQRTMGVNT